MKWIEIKVVFESDDAPVAEEAISDIFLELGVQGVVVDDPSLEPAEGWGDGAEPKPEFNAVTGFFPMTETGKKKQEILKERLDRLTGSLDVRCRIASRAIDEEDWAESWKAYFHPQNITPTIVVKPTWRSYEPKQGERIIELDPGMAFGTGTHPTTSMCVEMLEKYLKKGDAFLDVGAGSGILMLSAALLGAGKLVGVDEDEVAVKISRENLLLNKVPEEKFQVGPGDLVQAVAERFDVVAANILSRVILVLLDDLDMVLAENGIFICSGIAEENHGEVLDKMKRLGFEILEVVIKEKWVVIACGRRRG
ncbi:MAG: 50S ribosomal protein L11 methyltransferase [Desulfobacterales bacterium]|nr:50S ribosomal protein L11 methyltransferase [Desulfobacterales bacterium]